MGRILNAIDKLPFPLLLSDERLIVIPNGETLFVPNTGIKICFFLHADIDLKIAEHSALRVRTGDILTVPPGVRQTWIPLRRADERLHLRRILLSPAVLTDTETMPEDLRPVGAMFHDVHHLPQALTSHHHELLSKLRSEIEARKSGCRLMIASFCFELLAHTLRTIQPPPPPPSPRRTPLRARRAKTSVPPPDIHVQAAQEFILENYEKPLTLEQIARGTHLSREYLARIFHETTGDTVFAWLNIQRIEAAKSHLCGTNHPVGEIASLVGFSSSTLFCRTFKRITGQTPMKYRRQALRQTGFNPALRHRLPELRYIETAFYRP
ncbi:AraC family transcriptional regulator [Opitutaceae bacterium TAV3]|nr:AraC family transcriptional regulator [Opitutaceae bacterium TAV3]